MAVFPIHLKFEVYPSNNFKKRSKTNRASEMMNYLQRYKVFQLSKLGDYCAAEARVVVDLSAWRAQSRKYMAVIIHDSYNSNSTHDSNNSNNTRY
jgi:hypothetical protein